MEQAESFRHAKSECLFAIQSGPPGPGCAKIAADAVPHLRLAFLSQRSRSVGAAHRAARGPPRSSAPTAFPHFVGAGVLTRPRPATPGRNSPWSVRCTYEYGGRTYGVDSGLLWKEPAPGLQHPTVYVDPTRPKRAWVDLDTVVLLA